jgi:type VI secretion system secreted protein VgrG
LTGTVTLDAQGDPNAVFVFQIGSTLTTASNASVSLVNGADAKNVYWQIGSSATLGTGTAFKGTMVAFASITLTNGTSLSGRALARNGAVTMDTNAVALP